MASLLNIPVSYILALIIVSVIVQKLLTAIYNVTFHPLAKIPGPWLRSAFAFPGMWDTLRGRYVSGVNDVHAKYGTVVRIAPDAVSFATAPAWKDIYGLQEGKTQLQKDYKRFPDRPEPIHLFSSNDEDHARIRKILSHAFSTSALRDQEAVVDGHISVLTNKLLTLTDRKVDINHWFIRMTFDIMSHLTFGESFNSVDAQDNDPYTEDFFQKMAIYPIIYASREYSPLNWLMKMMMKVPSISAAEKEYFQSTQRKVDKRMSKDFPDQVDFMKYIINNNSEKGIGHNEIVGVTTVLLNAGGQELAVVLSSMIYYLLNNLRCAEIAQKEAVTGESSSYMNAAINETIRLHPPAAGNFQRRTAKTGHMVDGYFIPPDTSVGVNQFAAFRHPVNFVKPTSFCPERWLPEGAHEFRDDNKAVYQPFSAGPRNCLGKALALMVVSRTITKLLQTFDMELCSESQNWDEGQIYNVSWGRPPLCVVLRKKY